MVVFLLTIIGLIGFALIFVVLLYNSLVQLRNRVKNAWSQIDVQLKRRHDLIPNLVETARGYMKHEAETFKAVTEARSKAMNAQGVGDVVQAEGALSESMAKFLLTVENYPELKANEQFASLMEELTSTENRIAFSRQSYNDETLHYNNKIEMFPSNIIAGIFNFLAMEFFKIDNEKEKVAPRVTF